VIPRYSRFGGAAPTGLVLMIQTGIGIKPRGAFWGPDGVEGSVSVLFCLGPKKWKPSVMNLENLCSSFYARLCEEELSDEAHSGCR